MIKTLLANKVKVGLVAVFGVLLALFLMGCDYTREEGSDTATVYYSPGCPCCAEHARYLEAQGYNVEEVVSRAQLQSYRQQVGLERDALSCHITEFNGYFAEGHVPVEVFEQIKKEEPDLAGVAIPGMPAHAPGMGRPAGETLEVKAIDGEGNIDGVYEFVEW